MKGTIIAPRSRTARLIIVLVLLAASGACLVVGWEKAPDHHYWWVVAMAFFMHAAIGVEIVGTVRDGFMQAAVVDRWLKDEADGDVRLRVAVLVTDEGPPRVVEASGPDVERAAAYWGRLEDGLCLEIPWEPGLHVWEGRVEHVSSPESWQAELVLEGSWSRASPEEVLRYAAGEPIWGSRDV